MNTLNRWLLPKGVEEILPGQAWLIHQYERTLLDLYHAYGYELVIPPLLEYSESLLVGVGEDVDLLSYKVTDQLSGRTLALRADITPQAARIDAHSWYREGPTRLCYSGTVLHTRPKNALASRTPIEIGAELYGDDSSDSDIEMISLMLTSIEKADIHDIVLDLGHVDIYRQLLAASSLDGLAQTRLFDAFARKSESEIDEVLSACPNTRVATMLKTLVYLNGGVEVLAEARQQLQDAPSAVLTALDDLEQVITVIRRKYPQVDIYLDLAELRGYRYHTGLVFAAFIEGVGHCVANGGRYDGIGKLFGRDRPATGFNINVNALLHNITGQAETDLILVPDIKADDAALQDKVEALRAEGKRPVYALGSAGVPVNCRQQLKKIEGQWQICAIDREQ